MAVSPVGAQERLRISANIGQQASPRRCRRSSRSIGTSNRVRLPLSATIPQSVIYDFGAMVRVWRGLYAGGALSVFDQSGAGTVTARVPHPLQFNKPRTTAGEIADANRREFGQHITVGWTIPASGGLDFILSGGPSFFNTRAAVRDATELLAPGRGLPVRRARISSRRHRDTARERDRLQRGRRHDLAAQ